MAKESTKPRKIVNNFKNKKTKKEKIAPNKVRKYRLRVNPETNNILKRWFGSVRLTYNWALSCIKRNPKEYKLNVVSLRKRFINKDNVPKKYNFLLDTPKHVRDSALIDLVAAFKNNISKRKENPNFKFDVKYRIKKENQAFTIPSIAIKLLKQGELKFYPQTLKNVLKYHTRNTPLQYVNYDCKLTLDKLGRFYLIVPQHSVSACENQASYKNSWVALDPGVRTFQTAYSPTQGISYKFGDKDISRIFRLCKHLDKLDSIKRKSYALKQSMTKLRFKIKNLVKEVHCKIVHFLVTNFQNIIIPPFNVGQMIKKGNRKISSKTVRKMVCWSHYGFRQRLLTKAKEIGVSVHVLGEEYTTKTCTNCMKINHKVKAEKVLCCPHCHVKVDRDVSGARNIFLKNIASWNEP
jgi:putative transposase